MAKLQSLGHNDALLPLHRYSSFLLAHQSLAFKYEQAFACGPGRNACKHLHLVFIQQNFFHPLSRITSSN